jgi:hypothetical protein
LVKILILKKVIAKARVYWLLFILLIITAFLIGGYATKYVDVVEEIVVFENAELIDAKLKANGFISEDKTTSIKVIYFWDKYCPCNANVLAHFLEMLDEYQGHSVDFYIADLTKSGPSESIASSSFSKFENTDLKIVDKKYLSGLASLVAYSPSVIVWDQNHQLSYFGPHHLGLTCNAGSSFIKKTVDSLLNGIEVKNINTVGEGCFCRVE